jgi:hypothetical protein
MSTESKEPYTQPDPTELSALEPTEPTESSCHRSVNKPITAIETAGSPRLNY